MTMPHSGRLALQVCLALAAILALSIPADAKVANSKAKEKDSKARAPVQITYTKHIAPILFKNCAGCHHPGAVGPFSLLSYQDAAKRAEHLVEITETRRMPPWKAEPDFGKFRDERRLTDRELALIAKWAKSGAPQGDPKDMPEAPEFPHDWKLGEPDMVLKMAKPFAVPASGRDIYRCFVIPIPADRDKMVAAVEFRPGNAKIVHHAIMFLDANGEARKKDGKDGKAGFLTFGGPGIVPTGGLGSWAPGAEPRFLPDGVVKFVKKGSDLVLQVHYHPSGKPETDQSEVGVYFYKKQFKKIVTGIAVNHMQINIPAGQANYEVDAQSPEIPVDVTVLAVTPHMHNIGREFRVTAKRPDKDDEIPLVWITDWDFNWQGAYEFARPVTLPKGSVIKVHAVYDNSTDNPRNPNNPPKDVHWGDQTTDEMCLCGVQVITEKFSELREISKMSGYELAAGLEGGVPGTAEAAKKSAAKSAAKKEVAIKEAGKKASAKKTLGKTASSKKQPTKTPATAEPSDSDDPAAVAANVPPAAPPATDVAATTPAAPGQPMPVQPAPGQPVPVPVATTVPAPAQPAPAAAPMPPPAAAPMPEPAAVAEKSDKKPRNAPGDLPAGGVVIPEKLVFALGKVDLNKDGKITNDEVNKLAPGEQAMVRQMISNFKPK